MKNKLIASLIILSPNIFAHDLPNTFEAGQPIVASEVNENFTELESEINTMKAQIESLQSFISNNGREFVGITDSKTNGDAGGLFGLNQMCDANFSGSTTCQSDEVSTANISLISESAWIHPKIRSFSQNNLNIHLYYGIKTWESTQTTRDCFSWTWNGQDTNETGFILQPSGKIEQRGLCHIERPII